MPGEEEEEEELMSKSVNVRKSFGSRTKERGLQRIIFERGCGCEAGRSRIGPTTQQLNSKPGSNPTLTPHHINERD